MFGDHDNDEEIDEHGASDNDYDSGTDGNEYSSGESDSEVDMVNEGDWQLLKVCTRQNYDKSKLRFVSQAQYVTKQILETLPVIMSGKATQLWWTFAK